MESWLTDKCHGSPRVSVIQTHERNALETFISSNSDLLMCVHSSTIPDPQQSKESQFHLHEKRRGMLKPLNAYEHETIKPETLPFFEACRMQRIVFLWAIERKLLCKLSAF